MYRYFLNKFAIITTSVILLVLCACSNDEVSTTGGPSAEQWQKTITEIELNDSDVLMSSGDTIEFGSQSEGAVVLRTLTLNNSSDQNIVMLSGKILASTAFQFSDGIFPGANGTCTANLSAHTSCTVSLEWRVSKPGSSDGVVDFTLVVLERVLKLSRKLHGVGWSTADSDLIISNGPQFDFGTVGLGQTLSNTFTVTNETQSKVTGLQASRLNGPFSFKGGVYPGEGGTCGTELESKNSCALVVEFSPRSVGKFFSSIEMLWMNGSISQKSVRSILGAGTSGSVLKTQDSLVDFGDQKILSSSKKKLTLTNDGTSEITIQSAVLSAPFTFSGGSFPGVQGTCGQRLSGGSSCDIEIEFFPEALQSYRSLLTIQYNDSLKSQTFWVGLLGTGTDKAFLKSALSTVVLGPVWVGSVQNFTVEIQNDGILNATNISASLVSDVFQFSGGTFPGQAGTCGSHLNANDHCTVSIQAAPLADGLAEAPLLFSYHNGYVNQTLQVDLKITSHFLGSLKLVGVSNPYDFGSIYVANAKSALWTFQNESPGAVQITASNFTDSKFSFVGGTFPGSRGTCALTVPAQTSCTLNVQMLPIQSGSLSEQLTLSYSDQVLVRSLSVVAIAQAVSPGFMDVSLNQGGWVRSNFTTADSEFSKVINDSSGRLLATGNSGGSEGWLVRFSHSGELDPTFGNAGQVTFSWPMASVYFNDVVVSDNEKITVVGYVETTRKSFLVARFNSNGSLDTTFGVGGSVKLNLSLNSDYAKRVVIDSSHRIIVAGVSKVTANDDFALVRFLPDGTLDNDFDFDGKTTTSVGHFDDGIHDILVDTTGNLVAVGYQFDENSVKHSAMVKYNSTGSLVLDFSRNGKWMSTVVAAADQEDFISLAVDDLGNYFLLGTAITGNDSQMFVAKMNTNGVIDPSWASSGSLIIDSSQKHDKARKLLRLSSGELIVGGIDEYSSDLIFAKIQQGNLDTSFGVQGRLIFSNSSVEDYLTSMTVDSDSAINVSGFSNLSPKEAFLLRFWP